MMGRGERGLASEGEDEGKTGGEVASWGRGRWGEGLGRREGEDKR